MEELTFTLSQKAKKTGGDKYICTTDENFAIYIPQSISRDKDGKPHENLKITIQL